MRRFPAEFGFNSVFQNEFILHESCSSTSVDEFGTFESLDFDIKSS